MGGAGQKKTFQHHGAEDAALDVGKNAAEVVGAEAGGQSGEAGVVDFCWNCVVEQLAVAEEDAGDFEEEGDAGERCPFLWGSGVWGWFGGWLRSVHGGVTNILR